MRGTEYSNSILRGSWLVAQSKEHSPGKGLSPITGISFQTNDVRLRGGGSKLVRLEEKSAFWDCCVWFCMTSRSFGWRRNPLYYKLPHGEAFMSKPEFVDVLLIRKLHDLTPWPSFAPSVMCRTNFGRPAPTVLKKKHTKSPSVEPGTSHLPWILLSARHHHRQYRHFLVSIFPYACNVCVRLGEGGGGSTQTNIVRLKQNAGNWRRPLSKRSGNTARFSCFQKSFRLSSLSLIVKVRGQISNRNMVKQTAEKATKKKNSCVIETHRAFGTRHQNLRLWDDLNWSRSRVLEP